MSGHLEQLAEGSVQGPMPLCHSHPGTRPRGWAEMSLLPPWAGQGMLTYAQSTSRPAAPGPRCWHRLRGAAAGRRDLEDGQILGQNFRDLGPSFRETPGFWKSGGPVT